MDTNSQNNKKFNGRKPDELKHTKDSVPRGRSAPQKMVRFLEQQSYELTYLNESFRLWLKVATEMGCNVQHITPPPLWSPLVENPFDPGEKYYSRKEAAAFLSISPRTLASYIKSGKIQEIRYSERRRFIAAEELLKFSRKGI